MSNLQTTFVEDRDKDLVTIRLQKYFPDLRACIVAGWRAWEALRKEQPRLHKPLNATTRANFVYNHIVDEAKKRFSNWSEKRSFLEVMIEDRFCVRFKKLDSSGRSRSIPTRQARQWVQNFLFDGLAPPTTNLIAGYTLNELQTNLDRALLTCPEGHSLAWMIEISGEATPRTEALPAAEIKRPKVRAVGAKKSKKDLG